MRGVALGLGLMLCAPICAKTIAGPWRPAEGLKQYTRLTGRPVYRAGDLSGWCTWFAHAVAPFKLPRGAAHTYFAKMRSDTLPVPVPGAVVVWSSAVGRGAGHVGFVTAVGVEPGTFDVWDANFSRNWDHQIRWRRTAINDPKILGYICPRAYREAAGELARPVTMGYDLAFVRDGNLQLYRFDDRRVRPVTRTGGVSHPAWSPDGAALVFAQRGQIRRFDLATGEITTLTTVGGCAQPAVRDDGRVWFVRLLPDATGNPKRADLWAMDLDGGRPERLGQVCERPAAGGVAPQMVGRTRWVAGGQRAVVEVWAATGPLVYDREGRQLPEAAVPDAPRAALLGPSRPTGAAALMAQAVERLAADGVAGDWPTLSPDGRDLLLATRMSGEDGLRTRLVGYHLAAQAFYDVLDDAAQPAWSPTGHGRDPFVAVSDAAAEPAVGEVETAGP